ncbi:MAG: thiosulfate oxidation carrier protein SoxY [Pseudomonadota bacterium]
MKNTRREFLQSSAVFAGACALAPGVLLNPAQATPSRWPIDAFSTPSMNEAISLALGSEMGAPSDDVMIEAPAYIKDTEVVEVTISTTLPGVDAIALLVANQPLPLAAVYHLPQRQEPQVTTRVDFYESGDLIAVVRAENRLYSNYRRVVVTDFKEPELYDPFDDLVEDGILELVE